MDLNQMNRLCDKTAHDLAICDQKIADWNKFIEDYQSLQQRLSTIADKTSHEIMVPIGGSDLCFMSGHIRHTNEILVLLGDNYFVERSAKEANDIVQRRLDNCHKMLEEFRKERTHLQQWLSFSEQIYGEKQNPEFVEIVEPFDEQKEKEWREEHRRRVREYKLSQKSADKGSDDSEVNRRLEKLEIEESDEQKGELKSILKKEAKHQEERRKSVGFNDTIETVITGSDCNDGKQWPESDDHTNTEDVSDEIAFRNQIKERVIEQKGTQEGKGSVEDESESPPKMISRFKANRMKK